MKNLEFDFAAFAALAWWVEHNRKQALKIIKLIQEVQRAGCISVRQGCPHPSAPSPNIQGWVEEQNPTQPHWLLGYAIANPTYEKLNF